MCLIVYVYIYIYTGTPFTAEEREYFSGNCLRAMETLRDINDLLQR